MAYTYFKGPEDVRRELGQRAKTLRKYHRVTQEELSARADVSSRSLRRFENTGHGAMELVVRIAFALDAHELFDGLFEPPEARTLEEFVRKRRHSAKRPRGSR